jgi:hypothetical protein
MQTIFVLGAWSSGTTAVTGYIERLGAYSCPPHLMTNDPRTPNAHEPLELRSELISCIEETTLQPLVENPEERFKTFLAKWLPARQREAADSGAQAVVVKHPLSAFFLAEIAAVCDPTYLVVTRDFEAIEKTRSRRNWPASFGRQGAEIIYGTIFGSLMQSEHSFYTIAFRDFLQTPAERARMRAYLGLDAAGQALDTAEGWIRRD